jgi:hypothetical protein
MTKELNKPKNLLANAMPTEGFVLSVDGKLKTRFGSSELALAAAADLKRRYPVVQTAVYDACARTYLPVELDEKLSGKSEEITP